jgi:hypothetical protein
MSDKPLSHPIYQLLGKLENTRIHFTLGRHREDTILVTLTLVGERVEVDVFDDGHMEISRFSGSENCAGGEELLEAIIAKNKD